MINADYIHVVPYFQNDKLMVNPGLSLNQLYQKTDRLVIEIEK